MGRRKCATCEHGYKNDRLAWREDWKCKIPAGNEVCKFNKNKVKNFFTSKRK